MISYILGALFGMVFGSCVNITHCSKKSNNITGEIEYGNSHELSKIYAIVTCGAVGAITFPILIGFVF